jgi:acetyl esterase/lipase
MSSRGIAAVLAHLAKLPPPESLTLAERRRQYERAERVFPVPAAVAVAAVAAPVAPAEWLRPSAAERDAVVLYLHGGGYVIGSPRSHRHLAAAIAIASGAPALLLDYRLAPEHPFPAAVDDAVAAYRWLLQSGVAPGRLLALRDAGVPTPAGAVCISPWVDLTGTAGSYTRNAGSDPIVRPALIHEMANAYLRGRDPRTPLASPLFGDLRGLPPLLIQVGTDEVLVDDATTLADRAKTAGIDATLEVWDHMVHVWHWFLPMLDEAQAAIDRIGTFVRARTG